MMAERRKPFFLVIDDEEEVGVFFQNLADENGWDIETALDSIEAIEKFNNKDFSIVFIDIVLFNEDGMKLLKKLKQIPRKMSLFVMMTGKATKDKIHESYNSAGAYTCLLKPFDIKKLTSLIEMMLQIDPVKLEETTKIKNKKSDKTLSYVFIFLITFAAAILFLSYEVYNMKFFNSITGEVLQKPQKIVKPENIIKSSPTN
ncbi:response regulator [bacterium]|nr:response regulator [bacterium]